MRIIRTIFIVCLAVLSIFSSSSLAIAGDDYPNEPLLLERMQFVCPKAINLVKYGSRFFYTLENFDDDVEVNECFSRVIAAHIENPFPEDEARIIVTQNADGSIIFE